MSVSADRIGGGRRTRYRADFASLDRKIANVRATYSSRLQRCIASYRFSQTIHASRISSKIFTRRDLRFDIGLGTRRHPELPRRRIREQRSGKEARRISTASLRRKTYALRRSSERSIERQLFGYSTCFGDDVRWITLDPARSYSARLSGPFSALSRTRRLTTPLLLPFDEAHAASCELRA